MAIRLLEQATSRGVAVRVTVIDPRPGEGLGIAYRTTNLRHRLNVPASRMSASDTDPDEFRRWLGEEHPDVFAPRAHFGSYLSDRLRRTVLANPIAPLDRVHASVIGLREQAGTITVCLDGAPDLAADAVVLAIGSPHSTRQWAGAGLCDSPRFIGDVWAPGALDAVPDTGDVLLVGTGLTMIDQVIALHNGRRRMHAVSRHGLLPRSHPPDIPITLPPSPDVTGLTELDAIRRAVRRHIGRYVRAGGAWQDAVDSLRPCTPALWSAMSASDRMRFVEQDRRDWETCRHRMPADTAARIENLRARGELVVHTGSVTGATPERDVLRVRISSGRSLAVGAVLDCTGPTENVYQSGDPLLRDLLATGRARPGPLGLGIDTAPDGRVLGAFRTPLWTLGASRRGNLWETTAFPEIRAQAGQVAAAVFADLTAPVPGSRR